MLDSPGLNRHLRVLHYLQHHLHLHPGLRFLAEVDYPRPLPQPSRAVLLSCVTEHCDGFSCLSHSIASTKVIAAAEEAEVWSDARFCRWIIVRPPIFFKPSITSRSLIHQTLFPSHPISFLSTPHPPSAPSSETPHYPSISFTPLQPKPTPLTHLPAPAP